ncbi:MAG: tetratricopeptide repeat protein, partial [Actinomycetota bacterium]
SDEDGLHLRVHLGEAFVGSWNPVKAQAHLERAIEDARRQGDRRMEGKALRLLGDLSRIRGNLDKARELLERGLAIARETGDATEEAEGLRSHGLLDMFQGRVPAAPLWFRQALARYRDLGDRRGEGWSLQGLGWANLLLGRIEESLAALEEGVQVFGAINDVEGAGWCMGIRSWALMFQGRLNEADELARQLIELAAGLEDNPGGIGGMGVEIERVLRAIVAVDRMQLSEAIALASRTFDRFTEVESHWGLAMSRYPIAVAQLMRLELVAARSTIEDAARMAIASGDPLVVGLIDSTRASIEMEAGNLDRAEQLVDTGRAATERAGVGWISVVASRWLLGGVALRRGDPAAALAELGGLSDDSLQGMFGRARGFALLAEARGAAGEHAQAIDAANRAVAEAGERQSDLAFAQRAVSAVTLRAGDAVAALGHVDAALKTLLAGEWTAERIRALALRAEILDELGRHDEAGETQEAARSLLGSFPPEADTSSLRALLGT